MALNTTNQLRDADEIVGPVVSAVDLSRSFDGRGVLRDVSLSIGRGEFVALLGRSGSGKSTLLRILAGLDDGYRGAVRSPANTAVVFQDARLLPWARVGANVSLGLGGREARSQAVKALSEVGLADQLDAWPKTLSGGEAQRAALARALVREPDLLLLDEPFGALDALTRLKMHALLRALCRKHFPAALLVTHDVDEAIILADRVAVLTDGVLSLELPIDLPPENRRKDPHFLVVRDRLLQELGVADDDR